MDEIEMVLAEPIDAEILANISKRAFHSDIICGGKGNGGPPGYDSPQWQSFIMNKSKYFKILLAKKIIGGVIVFIKGKGHYYLGRIFIDPSYHRKGIGTKAMQLVQSEFPLAHKWTLETPPWNSRTKEFYKKQGFQIIGENKEDVYFEKVMKIVSI
jgi:ribosomal protein S18 acetylase RimI-like enzyme